MGHGDNLMPPLMTTTRWGLVASDILYADIAGSDRVPEVAIGRIPALSNDEMENFVDKLIAYENADEGGWAAVAVHDGVPDRQCGVFFGSATAASAVPATDPGVIACEE